MRNVYAIPLLVVLNLLVFGQTATFDFIEYDDSTYIVQNPQLNGGLTFENIKWSFATSYFSNWHPTTWLSYFLDNQLYGMDARGYHITNLLLHILATVFLYLALAAMTSLRLESVCVAALFAIHPQHVQSVAWIAERKDVLSGLFFAVTLFCYHRYSIEKNWRWYCATAFAYGLGLMAKPMLVTVPFVLLLLDYWPLGRLSVKSDIRRCVFEKLPLLGLAVASSLITFYVQRSGGTVIEVERWSLPLRVATAIQAYGVYIWRTVYPFNLTFFYPLHAETVSAFGIIVSLCVIFSGLVAGWFYRKRHPSILVGYGI